MKIFIPTPSFALHGGIRIILEWANRLAELHEVTLYSIAKDTCTWFDISPAVKYADSDNMAGYDCLIITSPHSIHYQDKADVPGKVFLFMQMMENMFRPNDLQWQQKCLDFYLSPHPLILISNWNSQLLRAMNRTGQIHYVGNGVNLQHFPIERTEKDFKQVLIEGIGAKNPSKDSAKLAEKVAARLKKSGYKILAYSAWPRDATTRSLVDEFYYRPDLATMNMLYSKATILVKATHYDARSCAPVEAMTKGTVTARAITQGDDDLVHYSNCLRGPYEEEQLYHNALKLLTKRNLFNDLSNRCIHDVQRHSWEYWMPRINGILCS